MALADFKQCILRVNPGDKSAVLEGPFKAFNHGDSIKLVVTNLPGVDATTLSGLRFYLMSKAATPAALVSPAASFARVPGSDCAFYATLSVTSSALTTLMADQDPGVPYTARGYLAGDNEVWVDCDIDIYPSPFLAVGSWPDPESPFARTEEIVLRSDLLAGVTPILAMPTLTPADREARMNALLELLATLAAPA